MIGHPSDYRRGDEHLPNSPWAEDDDELTKDEAEDLAKDDAERNPYVMAWALSREVIDINDITPVDVNKLTREEPDWDSLSTRELWAVLIAGHTEHLQAARYHLRDRLMNHPDTLTTIREEAEAMMAKEAA